MSPASRAICALLGGVALYDALCPDGQTISEGVDELLDRHPISTELATLAIYLHVANKIPAQLDVIHGLFVAARWTRKRLRAQQ